MSNRPLLPLLCTVLACESDETKLQRLKLAGTHGRMDVLVFQNRLDSLPPTDTAGARILRDSLAAAENRRDLVEREMTKFMSGH